MKTKAEQEIKALLHGAKHDILQAVQIANGGQAPAAQDIAELMAAWGTIALAVHQPRSSTQRIFVKAQQDMLAGLVGAA